MTSSVKIPWVLAVAAALALGWGLLWAGYSSETPDDTKGEVPFYADFELTAHTGMVMTEEDFAGQWKLIFFGFANCPDVCPTTLSEVAGVMDGLGPDKEKVQPLFITIDPERDTPEVLADFVTRFDAGIIGLSGTPEQTASTAENFHIYYEKIEEAAPDSYTMGHSSQLFLFGPDGGYVTSWQYGTPAEEILADLRERISS